MKFYDRVSELEELKTLSKAAEKQTVMLVITGVRRVGKTELIIEFFKKEKGIYLFVDSEKTSNQLLSEFSGILSKELELSPMLTIRSLDDFFEVLFKEAEDKKIVVAFDEFQRFESIDPSLPFVLQKFFDLRKRTSKLLLIISGSSFGLLKRMFIEKDAPLFQRPTNILALRPFDFKLICEILRDLGIRNFEEKIEIYSFFDGIPKFYEQMEIYGVTDSKGVMDRLLFRSNAPLAKEVENVISEEFGKESATYYSILTAIALGKTKANEIATYAEIQATSLPNYMYDVVELLGAVKREMPVTESPRSKKARFFLSNNFFKFWFRFVHLKKSDFELGRFIDIKKSFENEKEAFVGRAFEDICKEALVLSGSASKYQKIGNWWGNAVNQSDRRDPRSKMQGVSHSVATSHVGSLQAAGYQTQHGNEKGERIAVEIDVVALNQQTREILFVGCKWRNRMTSLQDLLDLRTYSQYVDWNLDKRTEEFILFSKSGFEKKAVEFAKENNWKLFDLSDLQKIFEG